MAKFSGNTVTKQAGAAIRAQAGKSTTHEGGEGFTRDAKSDLFLLAVTNMVGEDTFYESASDRDSRFLSLIATVVAEDPDWVLRFAGFLRDEAKMRSASSVLAAEYIRSGGPNGRQAINSVVKRPDEPMEILGYWLSTYGRKIPAALKRGLADAAVRQFNEKNVLKYDGQSRDVRMGDVIELVHPKPVDGTQSDLFKFVIDRRHQGADAVPAESLEVINRARRLDGMTGDELRAVLRDEGPQALLDAGYTWERLSGKTELDAEAWEWIIPSMGVMALVRNLRNFDQAGISKDAQKFVISKITDAEEIRKSRQLPFRYYTAFKNVESVTYSAALEEALDLSVQNIPEFSGGTLSLVDVSASMFFRISRKSTVDRAELGAVFGAAVAVKNPDATDLVAFGSNSASIPFTRGASVLSLADKIMKAQQTYNVGHGTEIWRSVNKHYAGQRRVVIFTDMQTMDSQGDPVERGLSRYDNHGNRARTLDASGIPFIHGFNLAGYATSAFESGADGRYEFGGFSDATFKLMDILEGRKDGGWPF